MPRTTDPTIIEKLTQANVTYFDCVEIFTVQGGVSTPYRNCTAPWDLTIDVNGTPTTYKATGKMLGVSNIDQNTGLEIDKLSIFLNALAKDDGYGNPLLLTFMDNDTIYIDQVVTVRRVFLNSDFSIDNNFQIFKGTISDIQVTTSNTDTRTLVIESSSHWVDFTRINTKRTNTSSQNSRTFLKNLPAAQKDLGFDYAVETNKDIEWKPSA